MHEASLVQAMFELIEEQISDQDVEKVTRIELEIGSLSNAEPLLLQSCFDIMRIGTIFEEANFLIHHVDTIVRCMECKKEFAPEGFPFLCPSCESISCEIISGDDITMTKLELEIHENGRDKST